VTVDIVKHTSTNYHVAEHDLWLSEAEANALYTALGRALGLIVATGNEYVDTDGDVWAEQTNGTWYIRTWSDGDSNVYDGSDNHHWFNEPTFPGRSQPSAEALKDAYPGGTWR